MIVEHPNQSLGQLVLFNETNKGLVCKVRTHYGQRRRLSGTVFVQAFLVTMTAFRDEGEGKEFLVFQYGEGLSDSCCGISDLAIRGGRLERDKNVGNHVSYQ
jgi:hypothetical protein